MSCDDCRALLSEGLDLCVRARAMDAQDRTAVAIGASSASKEWWDANRAARVQAHNEIFPDQPMSLRSATLPLWVQDQYEKDLAEWERRARRHLTQGCATPRMEPKA